MLSTNSPVLTGLRALLAPLALVAAFANAPFQCASEVGPERRMYEDPSEVLYTLAERFEASGDREARAATLRYLVERYPTSRFAHMARMDLEALGAGERTPPP
jgi:hypothetical protein